MARCAERQAGVVAGAGCGRGAEAGHGRGLGRSAARGLGLGAAALALACSPPERAADAVASAPAAAVAAAPAPAPGSQSVELQGLHFAVPGGWLAQPPQTSMRLAEYRVPGAAGDAALVVYRFSGGGPAQANIERWIGQFQGEGGAQAAAVVASEERGGLTISSLDVSGRFGGSQMPGAPEQPALENARLLALVVEGNEAPFFFKLQGPAATVAEWTAAWDALRASLALR